MDTTTIITLITGAALIAAVALALYFGKQWELEQRNSREIAQELAAKSEALKAEMADQLRQVKQRLSDTEWELRKANDARKLTWPKPERRMEAREVADEFSVALEEPWYVALHQELDDAICDVLDEVTQAPSATLTPERRTHLAGGAEALREFQRRLLELRARADDKEVAA
jgi:hypothetical protein